MLASRSLFSAIKGIPFPLHLQQGYNNFKSNIDVGRYRILAQTGQKPDTCIISCCDSRAAPETVFGLGPGQLFVVRNVANLVPPYDPDDHYHGTSAAIEFAVQGLRVRNVVVMGHGACGGVAGFMNPKALPKRTPVLSRWMHLLEPASKRVEARRCVHNHDSCRDVGHNFELVLNLDKDRTGLLSEITLAISKEDVSILNAEIGATRNTFVINARGGWEQLERMKDGLMRVSGVGSVTVLQAADKDQQQRDLELESIVCSLENLKTFPAIHELVSITEISLFGAWFDISSGQLMAYNENDKKWRSLD